MMLSHCDNFKIFGDGGSRLVLIATNQDGSQSGFVISNPFIDSLTIHQDMHDVSFFGGEERHFATGAIRTNISMQAGHTEYITGSDLEQIYDPVMQKTIRELLFVINTKIDTR